MLLREIRSSRGAAGARSCDPCQTNWRAGRSVAGAYFAKKHFLTRACRRALARTSCLQGTRVGKGGEDLTHAPVPRTLGINESINAIRNPSVKDMDHYLLEGARCVWEQVERVQHLTEVELHPKRAIRNPLLELLTINFGNFGAPSWPLTSK